MSMYQRIKDIKINIIFLVWSSLICGIDFAEYVRNGQMEFLIFMIIALACSVALLIFLFYDLHKIRETLKEFIDAK